MTSKIPVLVGFCGKPDNDKVQQLRVTWKRKTFCGVGRHVPPPNQKGGQLCDHASHDDVIKWKHFPRYWPSLRGIHRSPVNSPHKGQRRGALVISVICA